MSSLSAQRAPLLRRLSPINSLLTATWRCEIKSHCRCQRLTFAQPIQSRAICANQRVRKETKGHGAERAHFKIQFSVSLCKMRWHHFVDELIRWINERIYWFIKFYIEKIHLLGHYRRQKWIYRSQTRRRRNRKKWNCSFIAIEMIQTECARVWFIFDTFMLCREFLTSSLPSKSRIRLTILRRDNLGDLSSEGIN